MSWPKFYTLKCESIFGIYVAYTPSWKDCAVCSVNREVVFVVGTNKPDKLETNCKTNSAVNDTAVQRSLLACEVAYPVVW